MRRAAALRYGRRQQGNGVLAAARRLVQSRETDRIQQIGGLAPDQLSHRIAKKSFGGGIGLRYEFRIRIEAEPGKSGIAPRVWGVVFGQMSLPVAAAAENMTRTCP